MTGETDLDTQWLLGELIDAGFSLRGVAGDLVRLAWPPGMPGDPGELTICTDRSSASYGEFAQVALAQLGLVVRIGRACGRIFDGIVDAQESPDVRLRAVSAPKRPWPAVRAGHDPGS